MGLPRVLVVAEPEGRLAFYRGALRELAAVVAWSTTADPRAQLQQDFAVILVNLATPALVPAALEAAQRIRRDPRARGTPLLFIGGAAAGKALEGFAGPLDYLPAPPVAAADLRRTVQLFVDLQSTRAQLGHRNGRFLSIMAHELRTPLNAILGWATLLRTGRVDAPTTERALETIERNARVQTNLIDELQDAARIVAGTVQLNLTDVDPRQAVASALATMMPASHERRITLTPDLAAELPPVRADPARLNQVICQLLSNAIRLSPEGGDVQLRVTHTGGVLQIVVADAGPGIPADLLPQLFDRFGQDEGSAGRRLAGRGLGLTLVQRLVDLHGGTVAAESAGEGLGATFTVRLGSPGPA